MSYSEGDELQTYKILEASEVVELMEKKIAQVSDIVNQLPRHQLRMLLTQCKWDTDVFLEKYCDKQFDSILPKSKKIESQHNQTSTVGVQTRSKTKRAAQQSSDEPVTQKAKLKLKRECGICLSDCKLIDLSGMACDHTFCKTCLKRYFKTTVECNSAIDCVRCPGFNCNNPMSDDIALQLLDTRMNAKYQQLITNGFMQNNRLIKWCISPDCSRAIQVEQVQDQPAIRCLCGWLQCFQCSQEGHDMIPCTIVKKFNDVKAVNLETASWIVQFTKQCPNCTIEIQKDAGCNHMTCRKCHHEFCWFCLKNYRSHTMHGCVVPESNAINAGSLRRLIDCNTKYLTMTQSIKFDENMYKSQLTKQDLEVADRWYKIDFVKEAVEVLLSSRRSLADSFIFTYFYMNANETQWIRFHQTHENLLTATEKLSRVLESDVNGENFHQKKHEIQQAMNYCKRLHRAMFEHVKDGFKNDWWKMILS